MKKTQMIQFYKWNITQTDIWEKNSIKKEKTKNIHTAWKLINQYRNALSKKKKNTGKII